MSGRLSAFLAGLIALGAVAAVAAPDALPGASITGHARVIDGDTLEVAGTRVRIFGIDAPEIGQRCGSWSCGWAAKMAMERLVGSGSVSCTPMDRDRYGRTVAKCWAGGVDLGGRLVALGLATDYKRYSHGLYRDQEDAAKAERLGIWATGFTAPEDWRRGKR